MKRTTFLILFGLFSAVFCFAQTDLQPAAIVNLTRSAPITVKQYRTEVEKYEQSSGRTFSQTERLQVLDLMINEMLVVQAAERDNITVYESEVNQYLQQLRTQLAQNLGRQPTDAEFAQAVKNESGMEVQTFRDQLRRQMLVQKYLEAKKGDKLKSITPPTDEEIRSQFALARERFVRPETVRFSMIQVPYGPDAASKVKAKELADSLFREIGASPSRFDEVSARAQAANSGYVAGDGGFLPRNLEAQKVVGQDFLNTAFSLKQGEVSKLIEGVPGYQIIKVTESYAIKNLELDDIFKLGTRVTVKEQIGNAMMMEKQQRVLAQASQELVAELRTGNPFRIFEANIK